MEKYLNLNHILIIILMRMPPDFLKLIGVEIVRRSKLEIIKPEYRLEHLQFN